MKQKSMLFYERVKKSNSTLASTSGFSFTCPKSRTKIIPKTSLLKNMKTLQTMTEQGRRERVDWGEGVEGSANASAETLITKRKMSKFFCGLRGSLNVRGNKCNFFLSRSLLFPLSPSRSLTCSYFSEPSPGNLAHGFFPSTLVLLSCFFEVVLSFELYFGVFVLFRFFFFLCILSKHFVLMFMPWPPQTTAWTECEAKGQRAHGGRGRHRKCQ